MFDLHQTSRKKRLLVTLLLLCAPTHAYALLGQPLKGFGDSLVVVMLLSLCVLILVVMQIVWLSELRYYEDRPMPEEEKEKRMQLFEKERKRSIFVLVVLAVTALFDIPLMLLVFLFGVALKLTNLLLLTLLLMLPSLHAFRTSTRWLAKHTSKEP